MVRVASPPHHQRGDQRGDRRAAQVGQQSLAGVDRVGHRHQVAEHQQVEAHRGEHQAGRAEVDRDQHGDQAEAVQDRDRGDRRRQHPRPDLVLEPPEQHQAADQRCQRDQPALGGQRGHRDQEDRRERPASRGRSAGVRAGRRGATRPPRRPRPARARRAGSGPPRCAGATVHAATATAYATQRPGRAPQHRTTRVTADADNTPATRSARRRVRRWRARKQSTKQSAGRDTLHRPAFRLRCRRRRITQHRRRRSAAPDPSSTRMGTRIASSDSTTLEKSSAVLATGAPKPAVVALTTGRDAAFTPCTHERDDHAGRDRHPLVRREERARVGHRHRLATTSRRRTPGRPRWAGPRSAPRR